MTNNQQGASNAIPSDITPSRTSMSMARYNIVFNVESDKWRFVEDVRPPVDDSNHAHQMCRATATDDGYGCGDLRRRCYDNMTKV